MPGVYADELTLKIDSNVAGALAGMTAVETKSRGMATKVAASAVKMGAMAAVGIGAVAVGVGAVAGKMAMDFEASMAQIEANVGTTGADLEKLKEAALDMGTEFGVSATEAAEGLFFLQSAGLSVDDSISALRTSSKMAAMGLGDMTTIANGLTTAMTNWGIESEEAGDIVAKAVELGKAAPEEMTKILNQNAAAAAATGMEFDALATVSAFLTRTTGDANKAGTQMQGMLAKLIKPSQQGKKMVESLGISFDEFAAAVADDPVSALKEFDGAFADAGVASNEWMGAVFEDVNAINGAMTLVNGDIGELDDMFSSMSDRAGKVDEGFGVIAETAQFKLSAALEGIKSALIPIGAAILELVVPALEVLGEWILKGIEWLQGLIGGAEDTEDGVGGAFSGIVEAAQGLWEAIQGLWEVVGPILVSIGEAFVEVFINVVIPVFTTLLEWVTKALEWFTDLIGGADGMKEGIGGAFDGLLEIISGVREWWDENFTSIMELVETFRSTFEGIISDIMAYAGPKLEEIAAFFEETFGGIVEWFQENWPAIQEAITIVLNAIQAIWEEVWPYLQLVLDNVWDTMKVIVETVIGVIQGIIMTVVNIIRGDWEGAWNAISGIFGTIWDGIATLVEDKINLVKDILGRIVDEIKEAWDTAWNTMKDAVGTAFGAIAGAVRAPINAMLSVLENGINAALRGLQRAIDAADVLAGPFINFPDAMFSPVSIARVESGGIIQNGGLARVGENGPENLFLPAGAKVQPLTTGGGMTGEAPTVNVYIGEEEFNDYVLEHSTLAKNMRSGRRRRRR